MTQTIKYILLWLTFCCHFPAFCQQKKIDSLLSLLKSDIEDTDKVNHLNALSSQLMYVNPDTSIVLSKQALLIAEKSEWKKGIVNSLVQLGTCNWVKGNYSDDLEYNLKALKIEEELNNKIGISKCLGNIGLVYFEQGDFPKALNYYLRTIKLDDESGNKGNMETNSGNIALVYLQQGDYTNALDYFFKALKIAQELGNRNGESKHLCNIGTTYYSQGMFLKIKQEGRDSLLNKALDFYFRALKIAEELGNKRSIAADLDNIGSVYTDMEKYSEAEKYLLDALKLNKEIGALNSELAVENSLTKLYEKTSRYELAFEHYKKAIVIKDTLFNQEKNKDITRKEMNYEFEKKNAIAAAQSEKQKTIIALLVAGALLVLGFLFFVYRSLHLTRKQKQTIEIHNQETELQKKIIEEKQKDILDSINYAKGIQESILPTENEIENILSNSFVLYKPKDIVSGDFYFIESINTNEKEKLIGFAAADCTGHGVPGAFMSILGVNILRQSLSNREVNNPAQALDFLNKNLNIALRQHSREQTIRDGMDIAFCVLNQKTNELYYAGAYNPLWIVKNDSSFLEIKSDKQPIGNFPNQKPFTNHTIKLEKGDIVYLFTDGYADQFGGPKGKKFKYLQMQQLLIAIHNKPMNEQKKILEDTINNWKGNLEQVDDILVLGVRL